MIETIVNITTGVCYLVTTGVVVKYIYSSFARYKNHQSTSNSVEKSQSIMPSVKDNPLPVNQPSVKEYDGYDGIEYKNRFLGNYTVKNRVQVYIDRSSYECMKRFLSIAAPDTSMAGYVSRIINDHIAENATTINKIFEDSKTKLF